MMTRTKGAILAISLLAACGQKGSGNAAANLGTEVSDNGTAVAPGAPAAPQPDTADADQARTRATAPAPPPAPGTPGGLPDDRSPLLEPKGPIDPRSAEAAGQVVQHYGALIEEKRFAEAEKLWGDAASARRTTSELRAFTEAHLQIGKPGDTEGAAGSIYVDVPIVLTGNGADGAAVHRRGDMILRRVNDVPGSSEAQRRWHIERIEWAGGR